MNHMERSIRAVDLSELSDREAEQLPSMRYESYELIFYASIKNIRAYFWHFVTELKIYTFVENHT